MCVWSKEPRSGCQRIWILDSALSPTRCVFLTKSGSLRPSFWFLIWNGLFSAAGCFGGGGCSWGQWWMQWTLVGAPTRPRCGSYTPGMFVLPQGLNSCWRKIPRKKEHFSGSASQVEFWDFISPLIRNKITTQPQYYVQLYRWHLFFWDTYMVELL